MHIPKQVRSRPFSKTQSEVAQPESREESNQLEYEKKQAAVDAIRSFLSDHQSGAEEIRYCKACGETMQYLDAHFWLDGTNVASLVPLPFCPACDPDVLTSLRRKRASSSLDLAS